MSLQNTRDLENHQTDNENAYDRCLDGRQASQLPPTPQPFYGRARRWDRPQEHTAAEKIKEKEKPISSGLLHRVGITIIPRAQLCRSTLLTERRQRRTNTQPPPTRTLQQHTEHMSSLSLCARHREQDQSKPTRRLQSTNPL